MVIPLAPRTLRCQDCGWHKTIPHSSGDVRVPGYDHFNACPECGKDRIVGRPASHLEILAARAGQLLGRR